MTEILTVYVRDVPKGTGALPTLHPPKEYLVECADQRPMCGRADDAEDAEAAFRACLGAIQGEVTVREIIRNPPPEQERSVKQLLADADDVLAAVAAIETQTA